MIPKKIHYFWFGGPKTRLAERCIASWRRFCPGWDVVEWNESNADIGSSAFASAAFAAKKWGFVPDHLRMTKIRDEGGVYFDTDVELIRPIDDLVEEGPFLESGLASGSRRRGAIRYAPPSRSATRRLRLTRHATFRSRGPR